MTDPNFKKYSDCNIDELEAIVTDLENMSKQEIGHKKNHPGCGKRSQISY